MEINTNQIAIVAAIGAAAWFLLRKNKTTAVTAATKPAISPAPSAGGIWDGFGLGGGDLVQSMGQAAAPAQQTSFTAQTKPLPVAPAAAGPVAVFGGTSPTPTAAPATSTVSASGLRTYSDGSTYQLTENEMHMLKLKQSGSFIYP